MAVRAIRMNRSRPFSAAEHRRPSAAVLLLLPNGSGGDPTVDLPVHHGDGSASSWHGATAALNSLTTTAGRPPPQRWRSSTRADGAPRRRHPWRDTADGRDGAPPPHPAAAVVLPRSIQLANGGCGGGAPFNHVTVVPRSIRRRRPRRHLTLPCADGALGDPMSSPPQMTPPPQTASSLAEAAPGDPNLDQRRGDNSCTCHGDSAPTFRPMLPQPMQVIYRAASRMTSSGARSVGGST